MSSSKFSELLSFVVSFAGDLSFDFSLSSTGITPCTTLDPVGAFHASGAFIFCEFSESLSWFRPLN